MLQSGRNVCFGARSHVTNNMFFRRSRQVSFASQLLITKIALVVVNNNLLLLKIICIMLICVLSQEICTYSEVISIKSKIIIKYNKTK